GVHHAQRRGKGRVGHVHRTAGTAFPGPVPAQDRSRPGAGNSALVSLRVIWSICAVHRRALRTCLYTRDLAGAGVIGACSHAGPGCRKPCTRAPTAARAVRCPRPGVGTWSGRARSALPLPKPAVLDPVAAGGHVTPGTYPAVGAVVEGPPAVRIA